MPPDAFENEIGEERNGRRIDDLQAFDSLKNYCYSRFEKVFIFDF
jgi:hypothetical protein